MLARLRLVVFAAFVLTSAASSQTTWFAEADTIPHGNGMQDSSYVSIRHVTSQGATFAGDTALVAPGTYVDSLDFTVWP